MRKLIVVSMGLALAVCIAGLGVARAADMDNETYDKVFQCVESCNKCVDKCHSEPACNSCKPKCGTCKPKCEDKCSPCKPKCEPCKPKCEPCKPKCEPCKPKCEQQTCTKECEEPKCGPCCPEMPTEYPNPCTAATGEFDRNGMSRKNA